MTENERVRIIRRDKGLTLEDFGERIGIKKSALSQIENGKVSVSAQTRLAICREFRVRKDWLEFGEGEMYEPEAADALSEFARRYGVSQEAEDLVRFVLSLEEATQLDILAKLKAIRAAEGFVVDSDDEPDTVTAEDVEALRAAQKAAEEKFIRLYATPAAAGLASPIEGEDYTLIPRDEKTPRHASFCVKIQGDSMEPYIKDGDTVYVERGAPLEDMDVGIFVLDGDAYCKQICQDNYGNIYLLSANPKRRDLNRTIPRGSTSTLICCGKVILPHKLPEPRYK
jgi:phage repressor protein C with HTH and peptisase S24 domain